MDDDASTRSGWRALAASATGFALVGVGLIGGLTPSHGCPGPGTTAVFGLAPILIVAFAKDRGIDAIVMGSRGTGDMEGLLLGSVSHKVTSLAPCTCVTVK